MTILVVEDDLTAQLIVKSQLLKLGHNVLEATDGDSAWKMIQVERPDVVVTDWMMSPVDGIELCKRIRSLSGPQYVYIIMITALAGRDRFLEGMEAGVDDFCTKPFHPAELKARLTVAERIVSLQREVHQLQGLLPICSHCKKIRDEKNQWQPVEQYLSERTDARFSHGLCPDCYPKYYAAQMERLSRI